MSENYKPLSAAEIERFSAAVEALRAGTQSQFDCLTITEVGPRLIAMLQPPTDAAKCDVCGGSGMVPMMSQPENIESERTCPACLGSAAPPDAAVQADSSARGEADAMLAAMYGECTMCGEGPGCEKDCDGYEHWTPKHDASPESVELLKRLRLADVGKLSAALRDIRTARVEKLERVREAAQRLRYDFPDPVPSLLDELAAALAECEEGK